MDIHSILNMLPHRYPFLLVDRILEVTETMVRGYKNVTFNEPFFQGHFPNDPVMPGVLILEAMGQVASALVLNLPNSQGKVAYLTGIDKAKFRKPVRPGDQLVTEATVVKVRGPVGKVATVGRVDGEIVAEAEMGFVLAEGLGSTKEAAK